MAGGDATTSLTRTPRGPKGLAAAAMYPQFLRDPFAFLTSCVRRYGDVYRLPLGPGGTLVVNDPEHVASWLTDYDRYHKGNMSRALLPALGDGIPISDGEKWRRNRKALNPAFSRKHLDGVAGIIATSMLDSMDRWERLAKEGAEVDVYRELSILTMQALQRTMFSSSVDDAHVPQLIDWFRAQSMYMGGLMGTFWAPSWFPVPGARKGREAVASIRKAINDAIAHRRAEPTDTPDLLNLLLDTRYEDTGEPLSDIDLRDELMGLWFGGFDTTASALVWTVAQLAANPEQAERLRAESDVYTGSFESFADTAEMPFAKAAFDEAQRLQGAVLLTRQALEDDEIAGYPVAAGSQVGVSMYTMGRNPKVWDEPERYDPDRFMGERKATQHRYQFVMFGAGPRHCIGSAMAYLEAQFALTMIAQRFHVQPRAGFVARHQFHLSVGIKGGLPATIRARQRTAA